VLVVVAGLMLPASAAARSRFCTGGDTCFAMTRRARTCRRFRLVVSGGGEIAGSSARWSRHFPRKGPGKSFVRWALGGGSNFLPALDFRLRS